MAVLKVEKGHCLGIAESGNLNFDRCHFFAQGCPDEVYYSNEIYKYPSCLSIQENCYTEDCVCNCFTTSTKSSFRKGVYQYAEQNENRYLIPLVICCIITVLSIILNILQLFRSLVFRKENFPKERIDEQLNLVPNTEEENSPDNNSRTQHHSENEKQKNSPDNNSRTQHYSENEKHTEEENSPHNNSRTQHHSENEKFSDQIYEKTLVSYTIEDSELFRLLKRQCLNGIFSTFKHLVLIRVKYQRKQ
ncbi:uncharacterized protein [Magallana gigas]|uniref:uncharacterized protein isoform X2 n=1 Tax=Magallana gigas TaxID=29159 RepID=UPI0033413885